MTEHIYRPCNVEEHECVYMMFSAMDFVKGRALVIAPQVDTATTDTATTEALRYMARTKQYRTYLSLYLSSRTRYSFTDPERMEG